jgi:hypothetical protein
MKRVIYEEGRRESTDVRLKHYPFLNYVAPSGLNIIFGGRSGRVTTSAN